jgi:hypothetical protein
MTGDGTCATPDCCEPAAYRTRANPAYCTSCIDGLFCAVGLVPLEPFRKKNERRLTTCLECGVQLTYSLDMILPTPSSGGVSRCDWCRMKKNGQAFRANAEMLDRATLGSAKMAELSGPALLKFIERRVWPRERVMRLFESLHMECVAQLPSASDGFEPVHVRCMKCGRDSVHLPGRMEAYTKQGWCACYFCGGGKGPCSEDVMRCFESRGLRIEDVVTRHDKMHARCLRCESPRFVSLDQLRREVVPCYVCDGAADPTKPHRVYLFHFQDLRCFKVGITNAGNDDRLREHQRRGGVLQDVVQVNNRAAAVALEENILTAMAAYPSAATAADFPQNGWTETWADNAPGISLAQLAITVAGVTVPADTVRQWRSERQGDFRAAGQAAVTAKNSELSLKRGDVVVFTGSDAIPRSQWEARARQLGLRVGSKVTSSTTLLVSDDPTSKSRKCLDARSCGVQMVDYRALSSILDEFEG